MSAPIYLEARVLADQLLGEFGRDVVFRRLQRTGAADLVTGLVTRTVLAVQTLKVAILPASGGTLEAFDVRFMANVPAATDVRFGVCSTLLADGSPALFSPEPGDEAEFDGRTWQIMGNTPLNVDGTPVIFSVGFRGP